MNYGTHRRRSIALIVAILAPTVFALTSRAQVRAMHGGRAGPAPSTGRGRPLRPGRGNGFLGVGLRSRGLYQGWGYLPYGFYPDYDYGYEPGYDYGYQPAPPLAPSPEAVAQPPAQLSTPAEPLMIERRGDQWVRVATHPESSTHPATVSSASTPLSAQPERAEPTGPALPPAVLVFRDGHREEVRAYTIIDSVIYASSDYWNTGYWIRPVSIAQLDVAATVQLNRERGGKFSLPSSANEITMRP